MNSYTTLFVLAFLFLTLQPLPVTAQPPEEVVDHFKMLVFCKKRADLTDAAFRDWVINTHVPIVKQFPGIRGYVQNFVQEKTEAFPYDLVVELWFDHAEAYEAAMASDLGQQAIADVPNGLAEAPAGMAVYEVPVTDPPLPTNTHQEQFKGLWVATHHPALDYRDYMLGQLMTYSPLAKRFSGMNGYSLHFTKTPEDADQVASVVVNTWFASQEAMMESFASQAGLLNHLKEKQKVLLAEPAVMIPVEEHVFLQPPSYQAPALTK